MTTSISISSLAQDAYSDDWSMPPEPFLYEMERSTSGEMYTRCLVSTVHPDPDLVLGNAARFGLQYAPISITKDSMRRRLAIASGQHSIDALAAHIEGAEIIDGVLFCDSRDKDTDELAASLYALPKNDVIDVEKASTARGFSLRAVAIACVSLIAGIAIGSVL